MTLPGNLPCYVLMTNGKMVDVKFAKKNIKTVPDSFYTFDKGTDIVNLLKKQLSATFSEEEQRKKVSNLLSLTHSTRFLYSTMSWEILALCFQK